MSDSYVLRLGMVTANNRDDYWELRVAPSIASEPVVRLELTPHQLSELIAGRWVAVPQEDSDA